MTSVQPAPLINAVDLIRALPNARTLEIGNILFARFICPVQEQPIGI